MSTFLAVQPDDVVRLKKAHPCGGKEWRVTRTGADIGLECLTCKRRVFLTRDDFERRIVSLTPLPPSPASGQEGEDKRDSPLPFTGEGPGVRV